jgi:hypothetical protein
METKPYEDNSKINLLDMNVTKICHFPKTHFLKSNIKQNLYANCNPKMRTSTPTKEKLMYLPALLLAERGACW